MDKKTDDVIEGFMLIERIIPDYSMGYKLGLTDKEVEEKVTFAVNEAVNTIEKLMDKLISIKVFAMEQEEKYRKLAVKALEKYDLASYTIFSEKANAFQSVSRFTDGEDLPEDIA